jgi:hypothetical protein
MFHQRAESHHVPWLCAGCRAGLGHVAPNQDRPHVVIETRQFTGHVSLPVTRPCARCGTPNHLTPADIERWRRRGGGRPLLASRPRFPTLARPA